MNFSANFLGLDNAATPFGLEAMESLQTLNPNKDEASNAQIMFLVRLPSWRSAQCRARKMLRTSSYQP